MNELRYAVGRLGQKIKRTHRWQSGCEQRPSYLVSVSPNFFPEKVREAKKGGPAIVLTIMWARSLWCDFFLTGTFPPKANQIYIISSNLPRSALLCIVWISPPYLAANQIMKQWHKSKYFLSKMYKIYVKYIQHKNTISYWWIFYNVFCDKNVYFSNVILCNVIF